MALPSNFRLVTIKKILAVSRNIFSLGNCDIRGYKYILVFYETEKNQNLLKLKVFVLKFFCF
jgi:hypothetical protein